MTEQPTELPASPERNRTRRRWVIGVGAGAAALLVAIMVAGTLTHGLGLGHPDNRVPAIDRCVAAVRAELADPSAGRFDDLDARSDIVTEDDHIWLMFDAPKVASMWAVSGSVQGPGRPGQVVKEEFLCRAAFFGDGSVRTTVHRESIDRQGLFAR